jgi:hypothetical protein
MIDRYPTYKLPATVEEAVDVLFSDLNTQQMAAMGEMTDKEFDRLCSQLVPHLQHDFRLWAGNDRLLISCFEVVDNDTSTDPMRIIMDALRERIKSLNGAIIAV